MELPYVASWTEAGDAYMAAQESVAVGLTAMLWHRPIKPRAATITLLAAINVTVATRGFSGRCQSIAVRATATDSCAAMYASAASAHDET